MQKKVVELHALQKKYVDLLVQLLIVQKVDHAQLLSLIHAVDLGLTKVLQLVLTLQTLRCLVFLRLFSVRFKVRTLLHKDNVLKELQNVAQEIVYLAVQLLWQLETSSVVKAQQIQHVFSSRIVQVVTLLALREKGQHVILEAEVAARDVVWQRVAWLKLTVVHL
jgi:hypothetical protein